MTRLRRPDVAGDFVARPRLTKLLQRGREGALTLVCAPAGYGKTTLVSNFVSALDTPVAWVSLEERDDSLQNFVRGITAAIGRAFPDACPRIDELLGSEAAPAEVAARLADELDELDSDLLLVLDELECVNSRPVHDFLVALLEYPPRPLHMIATTRHDPPWPLATLRARGHLCDVRQDVLAFRDDEARTFIERASGHVLSDALLKRVLERTEGWPAAVRMLALALRGTPDPGELAARLPIGVARVEEYLAAEVLAGQPAALRDRLIRTSLFDRVHADLCDAVCGHTDVAADGSAGLDHVVATNLFVTLDGGGWLRFHPLLREHLMHELRVSVAPDEIKALHDSARDWFDANDHIEEAIEPALLGTHPASAIAVLVRHRLALMNADRWYEISDWVRRIRAAVGADDVMLRLLDAWGSVPLHELPSHLADIERELADSPPAATSVSALQGEVLTLRGMALGERSRHADAVRVATHALDLLPADASGARATAHFVRAVNAQAAGDTPLARRTIDAALREQASRPSAALATVLGAAALLEWHAADLPALLRAVAVAESRCDRTAAGETLDALRAQAGLAHYHRGELAEAEARLRGVATIVYPTAIAGLVRTLEACGRSAEADGVLTHFRAVAAGARDTTIAHWAEATRAELDLRRGDVGAALRWAEDQKDDDLRIKPTARTGGVVVAAILIRAGGATAHARAERVLDRLREEAAGARRLPPLAEVLAVHASLDAARGDEPAALTHLAEALQITRRGGMIRTYLDLTPNIVPLLTHPAIPDELRAHAGRIEAAAGATSTVVTGRVPQALATDLTNREEDVLELLAERLTNKEIAKRLHVAAETVKRHLGNVYEKLHVHGRREAVAKARALGLLPPR